MKEIPKGIDTQSHQPPISPLKKRGRKLTPSLFHALKLDEKDSKKAHMDAEGVETISGTDWKVTYKAVTSSRIDTSALKKALPDLAAQFTRSTTSRRFCIA